MTDIFWGFFLTPGRVILVDRRRCVVNGYIRQKPRWLKGGMLVLIHKMMIPTRKQPPADYLGATTTKEISPTQSLFNELISRLAPPPFDLNYTMLFRRKA